MKNNKNIELLERFFKGEISDEEKVALYTWFLSEKSPEELSSLYAEKWKDVSDELSPAVQGRMLDAILQKTNIEDEYTFLLRKNRRLAKIRWMVSAVAAVILGFLFSTGVYFYLNKLEESKVFVVLAAKGEKATVNLPDGTIVWLNSDSRLTYSGLYNTRNRQVHLEGEACFDVAKGRDKSFIVSANGVDIQALGTHFNVKAYADEKEVITTLLEGKVSIRHKEREVTISPDEQLKVFLQDGSFSPVLSCEASRYALWKNDKLFFSRETLEEIGKMLERMYSLNVVYEDESVKHRTYSGIINNKKLYNVLEFIRQTSSVQYRVEDNTLYFHTGKVRK